MTTLTATADLDALIGVRVRITRTMDAGGGQMQTCTHTGRLVDAFDHEGRFVVGYLDEEPRGKDRGGVGSIHLPYGTTVEVIAQA
jgi:hypothetical protein